MAASLRPFLGKAFSYYVAGIYICHHLGVFHEYQVYAYSKLPVLSQNEVIVKSSDSTGLVSKGREQFHWLQRLSAGK